MTEQIFISYSKKDSTFAHKLADGLIAAGFKIWIDRSIGGGELWRETIEKNLKNSGDVIIVVSPNSMASEWVKHEGSLAYGWGKRLFPILIDQVKSLPPWLEEYQWIDFVNKTYETAFNALVTTLTPPNPIQDLLDQQLHAYKQTGELIGETILQVIDEARESLILDIPAQELIEKSQLVIKERQNHERQLIEEKEAARQSELQKARQLASTQRQRAIVLFLGLIIAVLLSALSLYLYGQSNHNLTVAQTANTASAKNAEIARAANTQLAAQLNRAQAGKLASLALNHLNDQIDLALLMGVEASHLYDDFLAQNALLTSIQTSPYLVQIIHNPDLQAFEIAYSPDSKYLVVVGQEAKNSNAKPDGVLRVWEPDSQSQVAEIRLPAGSILAFAFDAQGQLRVIDDSQYITSWKLPNLLRVGSSHIDLNLESPIYAFTPRGQAIIIANQDLTTTFWDADKQQKISCVEGKYYCEKHSFHPQQNLVACGTYQQGVWLMDWMNGEIIRKLDTEVGYEVTNLAFSADGKTVLTEYFDFFNFYVQLWDITSGSLLGDRLEIYGRNQEPGKWVSSPNNNQFADARQGSITLYGSKGLHNLEKSTRFSPSLPREAGRTTAAFNPDGDRLAELLEDGRIVIWKLDLSTDQQVNAARPSEDWPIPGELILRIPDQVTSAVFHPDQTILAASTCKGERKDSRYFHCTQSSLQLFSLPDGAPLGKPVTSAAGIYLGLTFSPDGRYLAALRCSGHKEDGKCMQTQEVLLWRLENKRLIPIPFFTSEQISELAFSPNGEILAGGGINAVYLWDTRNRTLHGEPVTLQEFQSPSDNSSYTLRDYRALAFSPDGKTLAISGFLSGEKSNQGAIYLVNPAQAGSIGKYIQTQTYWISRLAFTPDGNWLAAAGCAQFEYMVGVCDREEIHIWDLTTGKSQGQPMDDYAGQLIINGDGNLIASTLSWSETGYMGYLPISSRPSYLTLWDAIVQQPLGKRFELGGEAVTMAFSSDGLALFTMDTSGAVLRWNLDPEAWQDLACKRAGRNLTQAEWQQYFPGEEYRRICSELPAGE